MTLELKLRPLERWPRQPTATEDRKRSQFSAPYQNTLEVLERELRHLEAHDVVLQIDVAASDFRLDGNLRSGARFRGPGIVLSFESPQGQLSFPCDHFHEWKDNLRAIALALEALRTVDRYHVTQQNEQYRGWTALPDKTAAPAFTDRSAAITWLVESGIIARGSKHASAEVRRMAIAKCHPDRNGGDDAMWKRWLQAAAALGIEV